MEIIFTNDNGGVSATLYNTHELARATHLAMLKDIMADKLAEERLIFCIEKISMNYGIA